MSPWTERSRRKERACGRNSSGEGTDLVVWLDVESTRPLEVAIAVRE